MEVSCTFQPFTMFLFFQIFYRFWRTAEPGGTRGLDVFRQSLLLNGAQRMGHERRSPQQLRREAFECLLEERNYRLGRQCQIEVILIFQSVLIVLAFYLPFFF